MPGTVCTQWCSMMVTSVATYSGWRAALICVPPLGFSLTQHVLTFISSLPLLFPSLHLLPPPALRKWSPLYSTHHFRAEGRTSTSCSTHTYRRGTQIEADGTAAGRKETRSVWRLYFTYHFRADSTTSTSCSRHTFHRGMD